MILPDGDWSRHHSAGLARHDHSRPIPSGVCQTYGIRARAGMTCACWPGQKQGRVGATRDGEKQTVHSTRRYARMTHEPSQREAANPDADDIRVAELKERIEVLNDLGDAELGSFTRLDWIACIVLGAILPLLVLYWGAP